LGSEGLKKGDLLLGKWVDFQPADLNDADRYTFTKQRRRERRPSSIGLNIRGRVREFIQGVPHVENVNGPPFEHRSTDVPGVDEGSRLDGWDGSPLSRQSQRVTLDEVDLDVIGAAEPGRSLRDRLQDRLQIGRRAADEQ
jgi:hypothetical protein